MSTISIYEYLATRIDAAFKTYALKKRFAGGDDSKILAAAKEKDAEVAKLEKVIEFCKEIQLDM